MGVDIQLELIRVDAIDRRLVFCIFVGYLTRHISTWAAFDRLMVSRWQ
ncbi:hypothetical protein DESC_940045 [Desulfosarcina cetonica]|nr:hypothetical protein DESC_940045 [Desulfosarcina cetonica]